jgi:hypothetical protein
LVSFEWEAAQESTCLKSKYISSIVLGFEMKALKILAVAALVAAPLAVAAPATAAPVAESTYSGLAVATPAGLGDDFSKWVCNRWGLACN